MHKNKLELIISVLAIFLIAWATNLLREPPKTPMPFIETKVDTTLLDERFILEIPEISISAPIIPDVPGNDQETYDQALENGVAQYLGTGKPGEGRNIFIFGHSSNYAWAPGNFKEVFRNLNKLAIDDQIRILYHGEEFFYKVTKKEVIKPTQIDVLMNPEEGEQLTLMTCTPVGTALNRLIVIARPI